MANSHSEMWDDSLLVDSWNEALEEYKDSTITAYMLEERVEDVLKNAEMERDVHEKPYYKEREASDEQVIDLHAKENLFKESADVPTISAGDGSQKRNGNHPGSNQASESMHSNGPAPPQHLIGQVHDESLKNLLMSWYYAGYYTGLYEGQQQGAARK